MSGHPSYPWKEGDALFAAELNAAIANNISGPFLPLTGGTITDHLTGSVLDVALDIVSTAVGSGVNGPATAQLGFRVDHRKVNWETTTQVGEIDGMEVFVRGGGPGSDIGGIMLNVQSRGQGFTAGHEYVCSTYDFNPAVNAIDNLLDSQLLVIDGPSNKIYGHVLSLNNSNKYAQGILFQGSISSGGAYWNDYITCRRPDGIVFNIDGEGAVKSVKGIGVWGSAGPSSKPTVTGAKGGNAALTSLLAALANYGLVTDSTT